MVTTLRQQSAPFFRLPDFARDSKLCVAYRAKEEISRTRVRAPFSFYLSFKAPVEGLCWKPKYRANIIHHLIFVFFLYFFHHSSCRKDQFTVFRLKFATQDFTDPGLLKIRRTLTGLSLWFCFNKCFCSQGDPGPGVASLCTDVFPP